MRDTVEAHGAFERLHVHPVALPAAAGRRAEFFADISNLIEHFSFRLKLLTADVCLVDLCDAPDVAHRSCGEAVEERACCSAVRRGDEWIISPIDVEAETLRPLREDTDIFAGIPFGVQIDEIGLQSFDMFGTYACTPVFVAVRGDRKSTRLNS